MKKAWTIICSVALVCLVMGVLLAGVGFFTGGSPASIINHGSLDGFIERLTINGNIFRDMILSLFPG